MECVLEVTNANVFHFPGKGIHWMKGSSGWAGDDCSIAVTSIQLSRPYSGSVGYQEWNYYSLSVG